MESLCVAVIGANGVGKSHFIRTAMSLPLPPAADSKPTTARIVVDNVPYAVTLFELDLQYFESGFSDGQTEQIKWPKQMDGIIIPRVHGVLFVYDVMDRDSIHWLPETLNAFVSSSLPAVLVANKCDNPESSRQIDADALAASCKSCCASFKTSADNPETARMALSTLLRAMILGTHDHDNSDMAGLRKRAISESTHLDAPAESASRPISQHSKHSRASSDMSLLRGYLISQENSDFRNPRIPRADFLGGQPSDEYESVQTIHSMLRSPGGVRLDRAHSGYSETEDSDMESLRHAEAVARLQRGDETDRSKKPGVDFEELVDRLLALKLSRADYNFADVFLCLYRKFTTPLELFTAISTRLEAIKEGKSNEYFTRTITQLRWIETLAKWVESYPNDFAQPAVREGLDDFIKRFSTEPIFSAASLQMRKTLDESIIEDDDIGWAKSKVEDTQTNSDPPPPANTVKDGTRLINDRQNSLSTLSIGDPFDYHPSASSVFSDSMGASAKSHSYQFYSYEDYEREAATMTPSYTLPLTKLRYHNFMEMANDDIADEMTRIDWVMFSSIRIRDLVRHVSLSPEQKEKCKAMKNVNRMISHFNHIATWVANMILVRDKAKHRAQIMEKFMHIASKLRLLNNYNGLAAVLAGVNGTAILRLSQTRSLINNETHKRFARLGMLMGTQKGYFAYRLAWENSSLPRIPFIPLHRRDLVSAEEGSVTFVGPDGDRLNWRKFEVLGEIILPIMKSQSTPYRNLGRHDAIKELVLDCMMPTDEEDVYQRSVQVESTSSIAVDPSKKKFPWFANKA